MKLTLTLCFFLVTLITPLTIQAAPSPILKCLGKEELMLHKTKNTGPVYYLNQTLVNHIATIPNLEVSAKNVRIVCHHPEFGPSLSLIRLILLDGGKIFNIKKDAVGHGLAVGQLGSFIEQAPHIMFNYLSEIQALMPTATCLTEEIPEVQYFYDRYKYLEGDLSGNQLMSDKLKIDRLFRGLNHIDRMIKRCKARANKKNK